MSVYFPDFEAETAQDPDAPESCAPQAPPPETHPIGLDQLDGLLADAICVVDAQGRFLAVRGACEAIFGYKPEEMVGRPMIDFVFHLDRPRTQQAVRRVMDGFRQRHFENRYVRKDGRLVHIMWSATWSEADGVRVAVARDITDRIESEVRGENLPPSDPAAAWKLRSSPPRLVPPGLSAIPLSAQDHTVMLALASGGGLVRREAIVAALGEDYLQYDQRRLNSQMRRLRQKVQQACGRELPVATVRGGGYRVYVPIEVLP